MNHSRTCSTCSDPFQMFLDNRPEWLADISHQRVLLSDGREVDFSRYPLLFRCLVHLLASQDGLDADGLAREVWSIAEYHPLRHGSRIRVTIHRLRNFLEVDAAHPTRLVRTQDGRYMLTGRAQIEALVSEVAPPPYSQVTMLRPTGEQAAEELEVPLLYGRG